MTDKISLYDSETLDKKVQMIMRQTNYTEDIIKLKLIEHDYNEITVIKEYLGINLDKKENKTLRSVNQEIYAQIRTHLNMPNNSSKYLEYKQ
jgi:hypothetical protein